MRKSAKEQKDVIECSEAKVEIGETHFRNHYMMMMIEGLASGSQVHRIS